MSLAKSVPNRIACGHLLPRWGEGTCGGSLRAVWGNERRAFRWMRSKLRRCRVRELVLHAGRSGLKFGAWRVVTHPAKSGERVTAGVAQLAEHNVANVVVVGSNPITRSSFQFRSIAIETGQPDLFSGIPQPAGSGAAHAVASGSGDLSHRGAIASGSPVRTGGATASSPESTCG